MMWGSLQKCQLGWLLRIDGEMVTGDVFGRAAFTVCNTYTLVISFEYRKPCCNAVMFADVVAVGS